MANFNSLELDATLGGTLPLAPPDSALVGSKLRRTRASFVMAAQASGDTLTLCDLPIGASLVAVLLTASASLVAATLAVGIDGTPAKYKAAAVFTAVDTPTLYGLAAAKDNAPLEAVERVIATIAAAALPAAGILVFDIIYATRA